MRTPMKTIATFALRFAALLALTFAVLASVNVSASRASGTAAAPQIAAEATTAAVR